MNIKFLKFIVIFMGVLIFLGIIILCIGIYYKINQLSIHDNKTIISVQPNLNIKDYYVNNDNFVINYKNKNKDVIYIYNVKTGKLKNIIELLK